MVVFDCINFGTLVNPSCTQCNKYKNMLPISPIITKRSINETSESCIIDLCSPIHKDTCRNSTPLLTNVGITLHENKDEHVGQALFSDCIEQDEYWEPEEYRNATANNVESTYCTSLASNHSKSSMAIEEVIDLCSPISIKVITSPNEVPSDNNEDNENSLFDLTQGYSNNSIEVAAQPDNNCIATSSHTISHTGESFSSLQVTQNPSQSQSLFSQVMTAAGSSTLNNRTNNSSTKPSYSGKSLHQIFRAVEEHVLGQQQTVGEYGTTVHSTTLSALVTTSSTEPLPPPVPYLPSTVGTDSTIPHVASLNCSCSLPSKPVALMTTSAAVALAPSSTSSSARSGKPSRTKAPPLHRSRSLTSNANTTTASASMSVNQSVNSIYSNKNSTSSNCSRSSSNSSSDKINHATNTTPVPPLETVFRSRYGEKTLQSLPLLPPSFQWEVVLLIDQRERSNALIQSSMAASSVPCQLATLAVGDFLWIIRPKSILPNTGTLYPSHNPTTTNSTTSTSSGSIQNKENTMLYSGAVTSEADYYPENTIDEATQSSSVTLGNNNDEDSINLLNNTVFLLDCIVERKSINDLVSSFGDGRYIEQKNRLKACNLRSTMYIVEGEHIVVSLHQKAISAAHVKTAIVSIHAENGLHVLRTRSIDHTIACLRNLHRQVEARFYRQYAQNPESVSYQLYSEFQTMYGKKSASTQRQLFGHQLRQIHGCSTSIAVTLMNKYHTTARFMEELKVLGQYKAEYVLSNTVNTITKRKIGPKLAKRLCQLYLNTF